MPAPRVDEAGLAAARQRAIDACDLDELERLDELEGFHHYDPSQVPAHRGETLREWNRRALVTLTIREKLVRRAVPSARTTRPRPRQIATRRNRSTSRVRVRGPDDSEPPSRSRLARLLGRGRA